MNHFDFLLDDYRNTLRSVYPTIKAGKEYVGQSASGLYTSCASFKQVSAMPNDCNTALHESIHYVNHKNKEMFISVLASMIDNATITSRDFAYIMSGLIEVTGSYYRGLSQSLMIAIARKQSAIIPGLLFNVIDELLAQLSEKGIVWPGNLEVTLRKLFGNEVIDFLQSEVHDSKYYPKCNGQCYE